MRVLLVTKASGNNYSIEAGLADGKKHFDHHGEYSVQPSPCKDTRITVVGTNDVVEITHIDADTYVGLLRMAGKELPERVAELKFMEQIDLEGNSCCMMKENSTLLYMVGVGQLARYLKFPRVTEDTQDVTNFVYAMMARTSREIVELGREATEKSESAYKNCKVVIKGKIGYWVIGSDDPLDASRPYEDGVEIVVVHRKHYKTISIYCSPKSKYSFGGKTIAGIKFAGHPKAAGSPRGQEFNQEDGKRVFEEVVSSLK